MPRTPVPAVNIALMAPALSTDNGHTPSGAAPSVVNLAVVEALLDEMVQAQDPWSFVNAIDEHGIPLAHRHQFYTPFVAMVSQKSLHERDTLVERGASVFHVRVDTLRKDIEELLRVPDTSVPASTSLELRDTVTLLRPAQDVHDGVLWIGVPT